MNWDIAKGKWNEIKGSARERWGELTDDELDEAQGEREQLVGKVQQKYGKTKAEAEREVDDFIASL
ncbi:CsbD family protein [Pseudooctadecabacter sp.]|uniref:CsbD family protein n=1 Tax=Pseudooctadecabacter sp. TaxID=1966338 RepID=UPI0025F751AD|nr:CsbD family protein [Pseudooctadecabacter sp.]